MTSSVRATTDDDLPVWQPSSDLATREPRSPRQLAWRRFRRNQLAMLALGMIIALAVVAILAPLIAPYDPIKVDVKAFGKPPSLEHLLGTDRSGRDVLSRMMHGARVSLSVGVVAVSIYQIGRAHV